MKGRVFGRRADKGDGAIFDIGQEGVLLGLVKAVHLIDKQDGAHTAALTRLSPLNGLTDVLDATCHRRDLLEVRLGAAGNDQGKSRFAYARRPPENHGVAASALQRLAQRFIRSQQVTLPDVLIERARTHPSRQRR